MTFLAQTMDLVRGFNSLEPARRAGILPVRDVQCFEEATQRALKTPVISKAVEMAESLDRPSDIKVSPHTFAPPGLDMD